MSAIILALLEEHDNAAQVKACLEESGHEVFVVNTFVAARKLLLGEQRFDLIISDVHLENGGNVFDFLRLAKKSEDAHVRDTPFLLFSLRPTPMAKYLADGVRTTARTLGAIQYIEMENFNAAEFRDHIEAVLRKDNQLAIKAGE